MRYRHTRYQGARYRGKRRPSLFQKIICTIGIVLVSAFVIGSVYQRRAAQQPSSPSGPQQNAVNVTVQNRPSVNPIPNIPFPPSTEPGTEPEPAVTVENTGGFELPVEGTHGIALVNLRVYSSAGSDARSTETVPAGTPFTILRESGSRVLARFQDGGQGWVSKDDSMVNLPDLIPSMIYRNSNAEGSLMKNLGMELDGITNHQLYQSKVYNGKLEREEFIMPVQYRMAEKIMEAQRLARERGLSIVLYEGFRPHDIQMAVADALQQLARSNPDTRLSIQKNGFNISYYINTGVSSHQMGSAVDVSLAQVDSWEERSFHGNAVAVPTSFTEYFYSEIATDNPDGIQFSSNLRYGSALPEDTSTWMPTPMHELSYLSGTFTGPTKTYTSGAWKTALANGTVKRAEFWTAGAQTLQDIFVAADMEPLASEWWHFNDLAAWSTAQKSKAVGAFEVGTQSFSMVPADAAAFAEHTGNTAS